MSTKQRTRRRVAPVKGSWDERMDRASRDVANLESALTSARSDLWDLAQEARDKGYPVPVLSKMMRRSPYTVYRRTVTLRVRRNGSDKYGT